MKTLKLREVKEYIVKNNLPLDSYGDMVIALLKIPEVEESIHFRTDYLKLAYNSLTK